MRTLVTGAAGFIGSQLTDRLLASGHEVVGLDNLHSGKLDNLADARAVNSERPGSFSFTNGDVTDPSLVDLLKREQVEVVFHLAAQIDVRVSVADPLTDVTLNVLGTVNVAEAARQAGVRKVVFASSGGSIYGEPEKLPISERQAVDPHSPYAASKASAEVFLNCFRNMYGLEYTSLALSNVYGPRQDPHGEAGVVAIFGSRLLRGEETKIFGDGAATRDYVYVGDVVDAMVRAAGDAGNGRRFNIGTGVETSVRELHSVIARTLGKPDEPTFAEARLGELQRVALDNTAARQGIGWEPQVDLAEGIQRTMDWLKPRVA